MAIASSAALGLGLSVIISIGLRSQSKNALADIGALQKFTLNQLTPIPGIEKIRPSFASNRVRYKTALPLPSTLLRR